MSNTAVRVVFFASLREVVGHSELVLNATTIDELWQVLATHIADEALGELQRDNVRIAINQQLIDGEVQLHAGDEIAFLPPVTGG